MAKVVEFPDWSHMSLLRLGILTIPVWCLHCNTAADEFRELREMDLGQIQNKLE